MVRITVEMVRKKTEHHERLLGPVEEIALHQENIEKIEYLQDWCPNLKILLLQHNLISKIENLNKLKSLTYLNLALNNIEIIENLERCEMLEKLDLTLNFIGEITSVESLKGNYNLEELYLVGNPCTDYENYRDFIIGTLPQLKSLDGMDIERIDIIQAQQKLPTIKSDILFEQENYRQQRLKQKDRLERNLKDKWEELRLLDPEERTKKFYSEKSEHAPEVRQDLERFRLLKLQEEDDIEKAKEPKKREVKLFAPDGRPFNINQPKVDFIFNDEDRKQFILDIAVFKHLDTSLIDIDVQPNYVRATIKGKIFQFALPMEIDTFRATAKRSQTTGHLVVTLPKAGIKIEDDEIVTTQKPKSNKGADNKYKAQLCSEHKAEDCINSMYQSKREYLEIGPPPKDMLDLTKMTDTTKSKVVYADHRFLAPNEKIPSKDFIDNPDVPALV